MFFHPGSFSRFPNEISPKDKDGRFDGFQFGVEGPLHGGLGQSIIKFLVSLQIFQISQPKVKWCFEPLRYETCGLLDLECT